MNNNVTAGIAMSNIDLSVHFFDLAMETRETRSEIKKKKKEKRKKTLCGVKDYHYDIERIHSRDQRPYWFT